jgi:hypothetical protein
LIELLVVIAIIALLAALILPALGAAKNTSRSTDRSKPSRIIGSRPVVGYPGIAPQYPVPVRSDGLAITRYCRTKGYQFESTGDS